MLVLILKLFDVKEYRTKFVNFLVFPGKLFTNQVEVLSEED